LLTAEAIVSAV